jgi:hypothetical protein
MAEPPATMIPFVERMPRAPMVEKHRSMSWITDRLAGIPQRRTPLWWWCAVAVAGSLASVFFWYLGLVPDLATVRDRARTRVAKFAYYSHWAGGEAIANGGITRWLTWSSRASPLHWCCRCTRPCHSISPRRSSPAGTQRSSLPILLLAQSSVGSPWF